MLRQDAKKGEGAMGYNYNISEIRTRNLALHQQNLQEL